MLTTEFYRNADVELMVQLYGSARDSFPAQQIIIGTEGSMRVLRATGDVSGLEKYALGFAACWRGQKNPESVSDEAWKRLMDEVSPEHMVGAGDDESLDLSRPDRFEHEPNLIG